MYVRKIKNWCKLVVMKNIKFATLVNKSGIRLVENVQFVEN